MQVNYDSCFPLMHMKLHGYSIPFEEFLITHVENGTGLELCQLCGADVSCAAELYQSQVWNGVPEYENDWTCSSCFGAVWRDERVRNFDQDWNDGHPL